MLVISCVQYIGILPRYCDGQNDVNINIIKGLRMYSDLDVASIIGTRPSLLVTASGISPGRIVECGR